MIVFAEYRAYCTIFALTRQARLFGGRAGRSQREVKYCSKCGNELLDEAVICPKCGCPTENNQSKTIIDEHNNATARKNLFTGLLLNVFSIIIPLILLIFLLVGNDGSSLIQNITTDTGDSHSADATISIETDISSNGLSIAMGGGIVIFAIGLAVYFVKQKRVKTILAYVYLIAAIADFALFFFVWMGYIIVTCFLGAVGLIPGILQIRAGMKFVIGCKYYER